MALALLWGCSDEDGAGHLPDASTADAIPSTQFVLFVSKTWSLAANGSAHQLVITDRPLADGCALASDQHTKAGGAGVELVIHLPDPAPEKCPSSQSHDVMNCRGVPAGSEAFVTKGCAFYRTFDDAGNVTGEDGALSGTVVINGTDSQCAMQARFSFKGAAFAESFALYDGATAEPWCRESDQLPAVK